MTKTEYERIPTRKQDKCAQKARELARLLEQEKGVKMPAHQAIRVALDEALARRAQVPGGAS